MKEMESCIFDTIITSPPYNLNIKYNTYKDDLEFEEYLKFINDVFIECKRLLKDDGSIFLNIGSSNSNPWIPFEIAFMLRNILVLQNHIIWVKSISIKKTSYGHYKPINSDRYLNHTHENIFHFTKNGDVKLNRKSIGVPYMDKNNLKAKTVNEDCRCRGNTWFIPYETIINKNDKGNHPAIFPEKLVEMCIKLNDGENIFDPFMGTGTTMLVSRDLNCKSVGIEIDKQYYDYAKNRINNLLKL
jgi:site-specific DNA-methyltransferase (adenine-specific)